MTHETGKDETMRTISKTSDMRSIDAYRSTAPQQIDGDWVVITKYGRTMDDGGGYIHTMQVRECTEDELKRGRIKELKSSIAKMNVWPDDYGDRDKFIARKAEMIDELKRLEA